MSTKSRFAVQAVTDLALRERTGPVALARVAERLGVSLSYLEQLFARLRRAGIVESTRGPGGGYTLGRRPAEISVADVVAAVEDERADETEAPLALTRELWAELDDVMLRHLATVPVAQLVDDARARGALPEAEAAPGTPRRGIAPLAPSKPAPVRTSAPNSVFAFGQSFVGSR